MYKINVQSLLLLELKIISVNFVSWIFTYLCTKLTYLGHFDDSVVRCSDNNIIIVIAVTGILRNQHNIGMDRAL